jgi:hypothetical protein
MSLFQTPVTLSDLTTLQQGIQFFTNTAEATAQVALINTPGTTTSSVFTYAAQLLQNLSSGIGGAQVAMGVSAIAEGGTIAVGTNNTTPNTLTFLATQFLPDQFNLGVASQAQTGIPAPVFASEALGLALASTPGFMTTWAGLSNTAFIQQLVTATGDNAAALQGFLTNWLNFYSGVGSGAHPGLTVQQAAYGATLGDGVGVALLNPTSANLQTVVTTNTAANSFTPNTIKGLVANALIDNAEGMYKSGATLQSLATHQPLQGEAGSGGGGGPNLTVVDIIPAGVNSFETGQNAEPDIAVNPMNPMQMVASAFGFLVNGDLGAPYFASTNGGTTWSEFGTLTHGDTTVAWSQDGSKVLATTLVSVGSTNPDVGDTINTYSATLANGMFGPMAINTLVGANRGLDQPWIETGPANKVYEAYNNLAPATPGQNASIQISSDGGNTFGPPITLDRVGAPVQDDPAVRETVSTDGNTVYAVFDRWTKNTTPGDPNGSVYTSQLVVERSDNAGADGFTALGPGGNGVQVATPDIPFAPNQPPPNAPPALQNTSLTIGNNRIGAGAAIAVDPMNAKHVVVAYDAVTGALPGALGNKVQVMVHESTDGGMTWTQPFSSSATMRSGDTQLAILNNGTIGVLYNSYDPSTNMLSVHLVTTSNDFMTNTDTILATQINNMPVSTSQPYLGDYMQLLAVGNTFEGIFSASNADNGISATIAPNNNPASVIFQRSSIGTPGTANFQISDATQNSIDPFFFKFTPPVNPAPLVGVAHTPLDHALV